MITTTFLLDDWAVTHFPELTGILETKNIKYFVLDRHWVHNSFLANSPNGPELYLKDLFQKEFYTKETDTEEYTESIVLFYGSLDNAKLLARYAPKIESSSPEFDSLCGSNTTTIFYDIASYNTLNYYNNKLRKYLLNSHYIYMPLWLAIEYLHENNARVFIRPDKGDKVFDGKVIDSDVSSSCYVENYEIIHSNPNEICLLSETKKILEECRLVVTEDATVITATVYKKEHVITYEDIPNLADNEYVKYAQEVIDSGALKDLFTYNNGIIVLDICKVDNRELKVLECNCATSAAMYTEHKDKIIDVMVEKAQGMLLGVN